MIYADPLDNLPFGCLDSLANERWALHKIGGRLHDLCIRHWRTNLLLREAQDAKASRAVLDRLDELD